MTLPYSFRAGDTAKSAEVNENFNYLQNRITTTSNTLQASVNSVQNGLNTVSEKVTNGAFVKTGTIVWYTKSSAPTGYLVCNGAEISRSSYSDLFSVIGTTFGGGNGSTTFNVPNLINQIVKGNTTMNSKNTSIGSSNANLSHSHVVGNTGYPTLSGEALGDHNHSVTVPTTTLLPCIKY